MCGPRGGRRRGGGKNKNCKTKSTLARVRLQRNAVAGTLDKKMWSGLHDESNMRVPNGNYNRMLARKGRVVPRNIRMERAKRNINRLNLTNNY